MRTEELQKAKPVFYTIGDHSQVLASLPDLESEHEIRVELELKRQERFAEDCIRDWQQSTYKNQDGYYISRDIVYKVFHANNQVKKITGDEARQIKRLAKTTS